MNDPVDVNMAGAIVGQLKACENVVPAWLEQVAAASTTMIREATEMQRQRMRNWRGGAAAGGGGVGKRRRSVNDDREMVRIGGGEGGGGVERGAAMIGDESEEDWDRDLGRKSAVQEDVEVWD